jgi:hypothetical protein
MLSDLAGDIRHELGASYGLETRLVEERLAARYHMSGAIDASRTALAMKLLVERLARLHRDDDRAARMFVVARHRVMTRLSSRGGVTAVADRIEHDIDRELPPLADLATVDAVRELTIEQVRPALSDLELAAGAISMRGPKEEIDRAFEELGRKPTYIAPPPKPSSLASSSWESDARPRTVKIPRELADPLTSPSYSVHLAFSVALGYSFMNLESEKFGATCACGGPSLAVNLGLRRRGTTRAGVHLGITSLSGSMPYLAEQSTTYTIVDAGAFAQLHVQDRFWLAAHAGVRFERELSSRSGPFAGIELDLDLVAIGKRPLGLFLREEVADVGDGLQNATTAGLGYRY